MKVHLTTLAGIALLLCLTLQACGASPATQSVNSPQPTVPATLPADATSTSTLSLPSTSVPTSVPSPTLIQHLTRPGTPSYIGTQTTLDCTTVDTTGVITYPLRLNPVCDNPDNHFVERPVTADLNTYFPYLDIQEAQFGANIDWIFARIHPVDVVPSQGDAALTYFLELDLNLDGLSDVIIAAQNLALSDVVWTTAKARAWRFVDGNVNLVFDQGVAVDPDLVWVRRTPTKDIEFAFKPALLDGDNTFAWWAWTYQGAFDPAQFIPINTLPDVYQIDNTCAWGFNSDAAGLPNYCRP